MCAIDNVEIYVYFEGRKDAKLLRKENALLSRLQKRIFDLKYEDALFNLGYQALYCSIYF